MNIGQAAKMSGVNAKMIRRYEELGIIPKAGRSLAGYRTYTETDVHLFRFVKRARELGFSMKDIKQLVSLWKNKKRPSSDVKTIAKRHASQLQKKKLEIESVLKTLNQLIGHCQGDARPECPILDEIES